MVKAVILLSGGLDSSVMLAMAIDQGRDCHALSFDYGQRHLIELKSAKEIAAHYQVSHQIVKIDSSIFAGSSLVNFDITPHKNRSIEEIKDNGVPNTYVPARNSLFLAYAMSLAESLNAQEIYYGPNALDSVYPDCLPPFINAFQQVMNVATKQAIEVRPTRLVTPLIDMNKLQILQKGLLLNVPLELTFSCYNPINENPCESCDACILKNNALQNLKV